MGTMVEIHPDGLERCQDVWDFGGKTERLRLEMAEGRRRMFVWEENGVFCGGGSLVLENGDRERTIPQKRAYFSYFSVKQEFRSRGIGSALIDYAEQRARESGITELTIQEECKNERAKRLYERKGFCVTVRDTPDAVLLLKKT